MAKTTHIIGAGMAGLAAAVALAREGYAPIVYEAGPQAGGRCRSYHDKELDARIDNGNHLLLSGNPHVMRYLETIGALDTLEGPDEAIFPFVDLGTGERWTLRPSPGKLPWWLLDKSRRVPGTRAGDYLEPLKLAFAKPDATVAGTLDTKSTLYRRLWDPLSISALNTQSFEASANLFWTIIRETLGAGGKACVPLVPRIGLSESLIDPAIAYIESKGGSVRLHARVARLGFHDHDFVGAIEIAGGEIIELQSDTPVVLAVPAPVATTLLPGIDVPTQHRAIINLHYRIDLPARTPSFIGIVGGMAEWAFIKPGILSVTISAADHLSELPAESLAKTVWAELCQVYDLNQAMPKFRLVKEKRATFAATPGQLVHRPCAKTSFENMVLAGDWTDTGLPSTIEGAVKSGHTAAGLVLKNT